MTTERRKFTAEDSLSILKEVDREGRANTLRKYSIALSLYDRWRKKYLKEELKGFKDAHKRIDLEELALQRTIVSNASSPSRR